MTTYIGNPLPAQASHDTFSFENRGALRAARRDVTSVTAASSSPVAHGQAAAVDEDFIVDLVAISTLRRQRRIRAVKMLTRIAAGGEAVP